MTERAITTLFDGGGFFEGPRWRDGTWWVSDFYRHTVSRFAPDGTVLEGPAVTDLAPTADG